MYSTTILMPLSESVEVLLEVYYQCTTPGTCATWFEPPEDPEFEVDSFDVLTVRGLGWVRDPGDWEEDLKKIAKPMLDHYDELYVSMLDNYLWPA